MARRSSTFTDASWWPELLDLSIDMVKMNSTAKLSGRDTMNFTVAMMSCALVEAAARHESQHSLLLGSGVMEALEYAIMHDFESHGTSVGAYAAGAAVALVGRTEGGKALSREAAFAVMGRLHKFFV